MDTESNQSNSEKWHERQKRWLDIAEQIDLIADKLGKPVEKGIQESVIALTALGFETIGSCEGHFEGNNAKGEESKYAAAPWVGFVSTGTESIREKADEFDARAENDPSVYDLEEFQKVREEVLKANRETLRKLNNLLEEFYAGRTLSYDRHIFLRRIGDLIRVGIVGGDLLEILPREDQKIKLQEYQEEMRAFTEFLKQKYFQQEG